MIAAACTFVCWKIVSAFENPRLRLLARYLFMAFMGFTIGRIIASYLDAVLGFNIAIFSTAVTYAFNGWILYLLIKLLVRLKEKEYEIHSTGGEPVRNPDWVDTERVSYLIDELFDELKVNMKRVDRLKREMGR